VKEDHEVFRELALAIWKDRDPRGFEVGTLSKLSDGSDGEGRFRYTVENNLTDLELYFFELMEDRGLIRFKDNRTRVHLTADGQDYCYSVFDPDIWDRIKKYVINSPFDLRQLIASSKQTEIILSAARGVEL